MPVVYVDVLIVINWIIDYILLSATACVLRIITSKKRMLFAAFLGGVSGCLILLPPLSVTISLLLKLFCAVVLTVTAFPWRSVKSLVKTTTVFFIISALFSGILSGIWLSTSGEMFQVRNGVVYFSVTPLLLAVLAGVSYVMVRIYDRFTRKRAPQNCEYTLFLELNGRFCSCRALLDTGLHLSEPFSGKPVIIVERSVLSSLVEKPLWEALGLQETMGAGTANGVRVIPYRALGNEGLLPAFSPSAVQIKTPGKAKRDITGVYVAATDDLGRGEYQALIGSDVL